MKSAKKVCQLEKIKEETFTEWSITGVFILFRNKKYP